MAANLALLIGPSYADDLPYFCGPLEGVENDLKLMKDMLCRNGFQLENIKVLEGQMASHQNILSSLEEVTCKAKQGSVVVIHFSGHGYELEHEFDQGLIPSSLTKEMVDKYHIYDKCITGEHLKPYLLKLSKKGVLVNTIFDCCFSGRMYRGFSETDSCTRAIRQLKLSDEYVNEHRRILKSRSPLRSPLKHPVEQDEPMDHAPSQDTQPPSPMDLPIPLHYPVQEFWTPMLKSQGWSPLQNDTFIHIAACGTNERAFEWQDPKTNKIYGSLTSALVEVIDGLKPGERISYHTLKCLIKRKFAERNMQQTPQFEPQTPQFEGGNMNLVLFSFDTVPPLSKSLEIAEVKEFGEGLTTSVVLHGGWLQGVVDGEYNIYEPKITDAMEDLLEVGGYWVGTIDISPNDIHAIKSSGTVMFPSSAIKVGCKARLFRRGSVCHPVCITALVDDSEALSQIHLAVENQQMFGTQREETPDCIKLDIVEVEEKSCWRARHKGRMIVPYQKTGDEHLMAKNLSKYFRVMFAVKPRPPDHDMLSNVSFKVFKVENVPPFRNNPDKETELTTQAVKTADLFGGGPPYAIPTFKAHKVDLVTSSFHRRRYKVVDGTGDALVIQITNNNVETPIHVCVISYQADGSIVVLYPPKNGVTEVLKAGESAVKIKRVLLEPNTVRRMVEPDFDVTRPDGCSDVIVLYATTKQSDYEPLFQTAIELSPHLSTRGPNDPDGLRLDTISRFQDALEPRPLDKEPVRGNIKWLTIKREISVLYND